MGPPADEGTAAVMWLLGLGCWVQGFRCFPWMGVNFFLKDGLGVSPATLQLLQTSANLPMVGKPLYGVVSDAVYIKGAHRLPYVAIGAILQAISWLAIALLPKSSVSIVTLSVFLLLGNLGASIAEVANDAIVAEAGKQSKSSGRLQSFAWMCTSSAGVLGNLLGGVAVNKLSPLTMFLIFGLLLTIQFFLTFSISEHSLNLPHRKNTLSKSSSISKQLSELTSVLGRPEILSSIAWFSASYAVIPILLGTMFYYQTQHLNLDSSVIGLSKVFGQALLLAWSVSYNKWLKKVTPRKLLSALQGTIALLMLSDVLFVKRTYLKLGISDTMYVVIFSGLMEALFMFKVLPFSILVAQLCPSGCEGSLMAFVMSATALASIISGYLGVALAKIVGISGQDFSGLTTAILIQAACAALPLFWSSWIPSDDKPEKKDE